jgi:hypothetical protein
LVVNVVEEEEEEVVAAAAVVLAVTRGHGMPWTRRLMLWIRPLMASIRVLMRCIEVLMSWIRVLMAPTRLIMRWIRLVILIPPVVMVLPGLGVGEISTHAGMWTLLMNVQPPLPMMAAAAAVASLVPHYTLAIVLPAQVHYSR